MARGLIAALLAAPAIAAAAAPASVQLSSLDQAGGVAITLPAWWFPAAVNTAAPAMVLMHGCGGALDRRSRLASRYTELAARLNAQGVHVLVTDSFTPRGENELCTQPVGERRVTQLQRRRDALGALQWLAAQPGVDVKRLGLLGWSNGGSTVLAAINRRHPEVAAAPVLPSLAVAFYPGCEAELRRGFEAGAPLLLLLAELDDWTAAAPCKELARRAARPDAVQWEAYAGAYHGFDGRAPLRLRRDVPAGVNPGQGVHVGADAAAAAAATLRLERFLQETWSLRR